MGRRTREIKPGVRGIADSIWATNLKEGDRRLFFMNLFYNYRPHAEYVAVLERKDGEPFDLSNENRKLRLTSLELKQLHSVVGEMDWTVECWERFEQFDPFWPLHSPEFFSKK